MSAGGNISLQLIRKGELHMLVLRRKIGESIVIGKDIKITILATDGNGERVKIGIETPDDVTIIREELIEEKQEEPIYV